MKTAPLKPNVSLTELTDGRTAFAQHYSVVGNPNFAPDITIAWPDFMSAIKKGGIDVETQIALKFIHRLKEDQWFLTMECCMMDSQTGQLVKAGNRFDLFNGNITKSQFPGNYDPTYFANVLCDGNAINEQTYVNYVTFPWYQEIKEMHCQNNLPDNDPTVFINFTSCTYDYSSHPDLSLVQWPHMVLIYLSATAHGAYTDDADYTKMFTNRAADFSTMCPPNCNCYDWPGTLARTTECLP